MIGKKRIIDVCSSLVAHLTAVAVTRVRIPASYLKLKSRDGERERGEKKKIIIIIIEIIDN